jgi:hypothetical protein
MAAGEAPGRSVVTIADAIPAIIRLSGAKESASDGTLE